MTRTVTEAGLTFTDPAAYHLCLGAALARMETRAFYAELLPRLESIGLAGRPDGRLPPSSAA